MKVEQWSSKLGVVLAVAGSAVGFGNFLRFPGLAAQHGGGAFMVAYFCSLLLLGIPLCWIEWSLGRKAGSMGGHSVVAAYQLLTNSPIWKYAGILSLLTPLTLAMYYFYIEGWTLGYTYHMVMGDLNLSSTEQFGDFFTQFAGLEANGAAFDLSKTNVLIFFGIAILLNCILLYRGVSKGIEWFCKWSMPILIAIAVLIMIRVLTLGTPDAAHPTRNVSEGLGYMWNPDKVVLQIDGKIVDMVPCDYSAEQEAALIQSVQAEHPDKQIRRVNIGFISGLLNPDVWIAAAGQIFFSLSVGFGTVMTYTSYIRRNEDIALSSLAANASNEVIEVGIAGMMIVPAAVSFLGVAAAAGAGTFGLGFNVLPQVFASMPAGQVFGTLFFGLLSIAAVTSSISLMQPSVAFLEEFWALSRKQSIVITTLLLLGGTLIVAWFTGDGLIALDTLDFFYGTLSLYISCTIMLIVFTRIWGTDKAMAELNRGALIRVPQCMKFIMNWVTPSILVLIFCSWLYKNIFIETSLQIQRIIDLNIGAITPLLWTAIVFTFFFFVTFTSRHYKAHARVEEMDDEESNKRPTVS